MFPPTEEHPLRLEFWGDDVEEIRYFKVADQRSLEVAEHGLWAPPCRELLLTDEVRERAAALAEHTPSWASCSNKIAEGIAVEGMESLAPVLVDDMELLLDVLPGRRHVVVCDPERVRTRARRPGGHLAGVPAGVLGGHRGWRRGAHRRRARPRCGRSPTFATGPRELGMMWWSVSPFAADEEP